MTSLVTSHLSAILTASLVTSLVTSHLSAILMTSLSDYRAFGGATTRPRRTMHVLFECQHLVMLYKKVLKASDIPGNGTQQCARSSVRRPKRLSTILFTTTVLDLQVCSSAELTQSRDISRSRRKHRLEDSWRGHKKQALASTVLQVPREQCLHSSPSRSQV